MSYPTFASGDVLLASDMNAVGLWLVKTQTIGSAVSSVQVTGAFSSTYDHYLITVGGGTSSTGSNARLKIGTATTQYYSNLIYSTYAAAAPAAVAQSNINAYFDWMGHFSSSTLSFYVIVRNPNLAKYTHVNGTFDNGTDVGNSIGVLKDSTQHTEFTISPASGTLTGGTIRVYGYRN
jgi:hypothetical protein